MSTKISIEVVAASLCVTKSIACRRANRENWPYTEQTGRGGRKRFYTLTDLPTDVQAKVTLHLVQTGQLTPTPVPVEEAQATQKVASVPHQKPTYNPHELWSWFESRPESIKAEGYANAKLCQQVRALLDSGIKIGKVLDTVAAQNKVARVTLARYWRGTPDKLGAKDVHPSDYAPVLAPRYPGGQEYAELSPEAWDEIKKDWLRVEAPTAAAVYRRVKEDLAPKYGWVLPSLATVRNRLNALPWQVRVIGREGWDAFSRKLPYITRTKSHLHALEATNADGHVFDVRVKLPSGDVGRPVMVAWQDIYSGKILSYRVGETLNQHLVRLSFGDVVENYGIPYSVYLDNGREFANKWLTGGTKTRFRWTIREDDPVGIFVSLGMDVHWTTPYHGQSKPIERAFRDLCENIAKHPACAGSYTGNSPTNKPANYGERAMEWEEFLAVVEYGIAEHNSRVGRRTETACGRSFDETFAASYSQSAIRKATSEQQRLWLLAAEGVTVGKDGHIRILKNVYWCEQLPAHHGKKVVVRFDPDELLKPVHIYSLDGAYIGEASCSIAEFDNAQAATDYTRANNQYRKHARGLMDAERKKDAIKSAQIRPNVTPIDRPKAGIIAPLFERTKQVANGGYEYEEGGLQDDEQYVNSLLHLLPPRIEN